MTMATCMITDSKQESTRSTTTAHVNICFIRTEVEQAFNCALNRKGNRKGWLEIVAVDDGRFQGQIKL